MRARLCREGRGDRQARLLGAGVPSGNGHGPVVMRSRWPDPDRLTCERDRCLRSYRRRPGVDTSLARRPAGKPASESMVDARPCMSSPSGGTLLRSGGDEEPSPMSRAQPRRHRRHCSRHHPCDRPAVVDQGRTMRDGPIAALHRRGCILAERRARHPSSRPGSGGSCRRVRERTGAAARHLTPHFRTGFVRQGSLPQTTVRSREGFVTTRRGAPATVARLTHGST